jgi:hypothetical protein
MIIICWSLQGIKLLWKQIKGISTFEDWGKRIPVEEIVDMSVLL